jgi:MYND finger
MCNKSPGLRCKRCRSTWYCSRDCQKSDFPSHRILCKQFAAEPDRPSSEHKRAIFFPVDRDKPCLIWIQCRRKYDKEAGTYWTQIDPHPYLGTDKPFKGIIRIEHNPVRYRNLGSGFAPYNHDKRGHCVYLIHRDAYLKDGSTTNKSILASVGASCASTTPHEYRGPMIAMRSVHHEDYADITLADFRHLMDYLVSYLNRNVRESVPDLHHRAPTTVRGVKICCYGEEKLHGSKPFVSVDVTRANQISLGSGSISPISVCLGMPIQLWKDWDVEFRHDPPGWETEMTADSNPNVSFLMMGINPSKDNWGWAPMDWDREIGNVWAVRKDGRDLAVEDVAMMCHFARHKLQRMFEDVMESGSSLESRQRASDFITWDNMVSHWDETGGH